MKLFVEEVASKLNLGSSSRYKNPKVKEVLVLQKEEMSDQPETTDNKM